MQTHQRLKREMYRMQANPVPGITCSIKDESNMNLFSATIAGPKSTPYEDGVFKLEISIPEKYPFSPPHIKFLTPIYHPNIDEGGRICMDSLKMPPQGTWSPLLSLENILISIQQLMSYPNPDDPLILEIAEEYKSNIHLFESKARERTIKHANLLNKPVVPEDTKSEPTVENPVSSNSNSKTVNRLKLKKPDLDVKETQLD